MTPMSQMFLFSKKSADVIDGSEKCNGWLNFELLSLCVIERCSSSFLSHTCNNLKAKIRGVFNRLCCDAFANRLGICLIPLLLFLHLLSKFLSTISW